MATTITGRCHCGKVNLTVQLSSPPASYNPGACDCDFCRENDASYLFDPNGSALVSTDHHSNLTYLRQGDELAEFLCCSDCRNLVGVRWRHYGAVNVRLLEGNSSFGRDLPASPKKLTAEQKTALWRKLWFPEFVVATSSHR